MSSTCRRSFCEARIAARTRRTAPLDSNRHTTTPVKEKQDVGAPTFDFFVKLPSDVTPAEELSVNTPSGDVKVPIKVPASYKDGDQICVKIPARLSKHEQEEMFDFNIPVTGDHHRVLQTAPRARKPAPPHAYMSAQ